jgi:tRNA-specific 2-thiouridylase
VDPFVDAYLEGRTPSPCVQCNGVVKLAELFALAERLDAAFVATGHYARVVREGESARLYRGRDLAKDQSYFLHAVDKRRLERLLFPLGESTKAQVRAEASAQGLPGATKGESQELCFVPRGRYDAVVASRGGDRIRQGPIVDANGDVVGQHEGIHGFTVGQRKGLRVARGEPAFVVRVDAATATVHLGAAESLFASQARIERATWNDDVVFPLEAVVRVRARHEGAPATIVRAPEPQMGHDLYIAHFHRPVRAVSPGQVAVAYRGDRVLGGGTITLPVGAAEPPSLCAGGFS